ncbi:unnamed protein product [Rangifer tarandus platyrhynchus]|uniref:Uncharacterized protein n=1 Tax=Rangifer tarandus platyrhynchus TaxID=3082113 RepID=A0ABN8Z4T8_RANTA|nr:unnamed protein product [Rangifer tarandus platyrhynchus]
MSRCLASRPEPRLQGTDQESQEEAQRGAGLLSECFNLPELKLMTRRCDCVSCLPPERFSELCEDKDRICHGHTDPWRWRPGLPFWGPPTPDYILARQAACRAGRWPFREVTSGSPRARPQHAPCGDARRCPEVTPAVPPRQQAPPIN